MFARDTVFTRRTFGIIMIVVGVLGAAGVPLVDVLGAGQDSGFGPLQVTGLVGGSFIIAVGVSLLFIHPQGNMWKARSKDEAPPARIAPPKAAVVLQILVLLIYVGYLAVFVHYAASLFAFPFDYEEGEGFELTDAMYFSRGEWPYQNPEQYPFYGNCYPPLYHLMAVPFVWLFGPHLWIGRAISFAMTLVAAAAIGWAVYRDGGRSWWAAAIAGLLFLASNYVYHITPLFRLHMTMVSFETLTIVTLAALPKEERGLTGRIWVALLLLLAAGYTKQLAIWTAIAFFVWLAMGGLKRALVAGVILTAVAGGIFLLINVATDGYWWLNVIVANVNQYVMSQFFGLVLQFARLHAVILVFAVGMVIYELYWEGLSLYSVWFVFTLINGVLAGKWGAGEAYYTTSIAAACILAGLAFSRLLALPQPTLRKAAAFVLPLLLVFQARLVLHMPTEGPVFEPIARLLRLPEDVRYYDSVGYTQVGHSPTEADIAAGERIAAYVAEGPLPALSEEAGFPIYVGKPVVGHPPHLLNLYRSGDYDPGPLIMMIYDRGFNVIVFRAQFYPQPVLDAIGQNYEPIDDIEMNGFTYHILAPRP
jgi:hypothetical protein